MLTKFKKLLDCSNETQSDAQLIQMGFGHLTKFFHRNC